MAAFLKKHQIKPSNNSSTLEDDKSSVFDATPSKYAVGSLANESEIKDFEVDTNTGVVRLMNLEPEAHIVVWDAIDKHRHVLHETFGAINMDTIYQGVSFKEMAQQVPEEMISVLKRYDVNIRVNHLTKAAALKALENATFIPKLPDFIILVSLGDPFFFSACVPSF